jgi:hypothetical protein
MEKIPVTVAKTHLITIGERLYTENVELLRELVNNGYDADATEVRISIGPDEAIVEDNGSGMDIEGLKQYFNIGSSGKRENPISPKHKRLRIGEFGIGKFSVLSNCDHFEVYTHKGDFAGTVTFDKKEWARQQGEWELPFLRADAAGSGDGTKVALKGIKKQFDAAAVEKRLIETLPLKAPDFSVFINGKKLVTRAVEGRKIPFLEGTDFGIVHGEIVIVPVSRAEPEEAGVLIRVKQVAVKRLAFGINPALLARISGEVNADFLTLTTDRNDFLRDRPEYLVFDGVMKKVINRVMQEMHIENDERENSRVKRALKDVTAKIEEALSKNADWCPPGLLPVGKGKGAQAAAVQAGSAGGDGLETGGVKAAPERKKRKRQPKLKQLTPGAMIKKIRIGQMNLALVMDHFGTDGPESFLEAGVIYINRDHPLYEREAGSRERHMMNIARLICQEISLMSRPSNPRMAYDRQSKLLKDAFTTQTAKS